MAEQRSAERTQGDAGNKRIEVADRGASKEGKWIHPFEVITI